MDPQQRLVLEVSWEALEHAGVPPRSLAGTDTGVFIGVNSDDYGKPILEDLPGIEAWTGIGTSLCGVANRVSYLLDLRGPSLALDTACSASLVAVHQACQMLRAGETSLALAGGVSALIGPGPDPGARRGRRHRAGRPLQVVRRGRRRLRARRGRRRGRAQAPRRRGARRRPGARASYAAARWTRTAAPSASWRRTATRRPTCCGAHASPRASHPPASTTSRRTAPAPRPATPPRSGAGLRLRRRPPGGRAMPDRLGEAQRRPPRGRRGRGRPHQGGAGAAARGDPADRGPEHADPAIDWANSGLRVPTEVEPWQRTDGAPRRAAVCSYGYGGTIAHVLLEEAPRPRAARTDTAVASPSVIPVSARSAARLRTQAQALADHLRGGDDRSIASPRRRGCAVRTNRPGPRWWPRTSTVWWPGCTLSRTTCRIRSWSPAPRLPAASDGAVWVFSGHGSHWAGMGRQLLEPTRFRGGHRRDRPGVPRELGFCAREALSTGELGGTDRVQALTFAMQVGLAAVLRERGVTPAAVIGHSVGEVAACVTAGVFDLTVGAAVACYRARGFRSVMGDGAMALVRLPFAEAERRLHGRTDVVAGDQRLTRIDRGVRHRRRRRRSANSGPTRA